MAMALAACWVAPLHHMTQHKPPATVCTFSGFTLLVSMAACLLLTQTLQMVLLFTWPGFTGGTGSAHRVSHFILYLTVCGVEPVVTHQTSWLESTVCYAHSAHARCIHHPSACMLAKRTYESCTCTATKHNYRDLRFAGSCDVQLSGLHHAARINDN